MVTGFPCVHLFPCRPPVPPTGIPCYLMNRGIPVIILHVLHVTCKSLFALRGLTCYHTTSTSICFTDKAVLILQGFSCYSDRQNFSVEQGYGYKFNRERHVNITVLSLFMTQSSYRETGEHREKLFHLQGIACFDIPSFRQDSK